MIGLFGHVQIVKAPLTQRIMLFLAAAYMALITPHIERLPWSALGFIACVLGWRVLSLFNRAPLPGAIGKTLLVFVMLSILATGFSLHFSVSSAVAFFAIVLGLKLLELKKVQDVYVYIFLLIYLAATQFLFEQHLLVVLYEIACIGWLLYILLVIHSPAEKGGSKGIWAIVKVLAIAAPFVVIIFLFFPRIAPLWSVPLESGSARTGISDQMTPGDIASLAQSDERAFRAKFQKTVPAKRDLYWKGLILDVFDGQKWTSSENQTYQPLGRIPDIRLEKDVSDSAYKITMEATDQNWAFSLNHPLAASSNVYVNTDGLVRFRQRLMNASIYQVDHKWMDPQPSGRYADFAFAEQRRFLQIPQTDNKLTKAWVASQLESLQNIEAVFASLLSKFQNEEYHYSLKPPLLGENFVDDFLFGSKVGFCAHYASATAYIARLLGIPSRVVIGYQGGEYVEQGDYVLVHQYDAHAWVEIWQNGTGWLRVDPTSYVAPERVESGIREATRNSGGFLEDNLFAAARYDNFGLIRWVRHQLDTANYYWQQNIVGYSGASQQSLMKDWFDSDSIQTMAVMMVSLSAGLFAVMLLGRNRQWVLALFAKKSFYEKFCHVCERHGYPRRVGEGPAQFAQRLKKELPQASVDIDKITQAFITLTFKNGIPQDKLPMLNKYMEVNIKEFKRHIKEVNA